MTISSAALPSSNISLWGQAWKLQVTYATAKGEPQTITLSTDAWEPEALRITFEVGVAQIPSRWWYADISIYNLNTADTQNALANATFVTLDAGFQSGPCKSSTIWAGQVLQVLYDREDVVDQKITFHCVASPLIINNLVNLNAGIFSSQQRTVAMMAAQIGLPNTNGASIVAGVGMSPYAQAQLQATQYPRGKTFFGKITKYLSQIADDHFLQTFNDSSKPNVSEIGAVDADGNPVQPTVDFDYSPPFQPGSQVPDLPVNTTQSIIQTPCQTPFGVIFSVLLDPRLVAKVPPLVVRLNYTLVTQTPGAPDAGLPSVSLTSNQLTFYVSAVKHVGDSRGNEWRTEVTGFSTTYAAGLPFGLYNPYSAAPAGD